MESPARRRITAEHLHFVLDDAFEDVRSPHCHLCTVPQPRPLPDEASVGTNWWLGPLRDCDFGCSGSIGRLWQQYGHRYELADDEP